jgi:hypothetical protein
MSHASPCASPSLFDCNVLAISAQLSAASSTLSLSSSESQASPSASPSVFV